jgi:UDP-N-acetylglucosamine 2-epimerase
MRKITVLSVIGTRPEAIKMAPVVRKLAEHPDRVRSLVAVTGQHRELLDQALTLFSIRPDFDLDVMRPGQSLSGLTAALFGGLDGLIEEVRPDWVLAQGDTTTVFVTAMVAFYRQTRFGHIEAGLRTGDRRRPFPEEVNRRVADLVADAYFAPTERARHMLVAEGCPEPDVVLTGNTVIDALRDVADRPYDWSSGPLAGLPEGRRLVLVTAHRRESFGATLLGICQAVGDLAREFEPDGVHLVYPVHPNPNVRGPAAGVLSGLPNVTLTEPLDYLSLVHLMKRSSLVLTDSGGIQEEAPGLGVPVLVMRDTTERPEGVEAGVVRLVGTDRGRIVSEASKLLRDPSALSAMASRVNPYGDGRAAERVVGHLLGSM